MWLFLSSYEKPKLNLPGIMPDAVAVPAAASLKGKAKREIFRLKPPILLNYAEAIHATSSIKEIR